MKRGGDRRVAHSSRVLVLAFRQNNLSETRSTEFGRLLHERHPAKVRGGGTPPPALGTSALPGSRNGAIS